MKLVIHRGAHEVGGSCVELSFTDTTILLDIGLPLDYDLNDDRESLLPQPLFEQLYHGEKKLDAVILSHAHLDHYGLAGLLPREVPVYSGKASAALMDMTAIATSDKPKSFKPHYYNAWEKFQIGEFSITPYLMDHSAYDAHGFLISAGGKNLFYTGDFRGHGRKAKLLDRLSVKPLKVNALMMEGTLLGEQSHGHTVSEFELEDEFVEAINQTRGIVLVTTSSQNIDRIVTIFKAARQTGRIFVIDFYTAEILDRLKESANLPRPSWPGIRVCYPQFPARRFEKLGLGNILVRHRKNGIRWTRIREIGNKVVMIVRPGFLWDIKKFLDLKDATWIYSMWRGYFKKSKPLRNLKTYLEENGVTYKYLHTSGHATISDMKKLTSAITADMIIPIHSFHPDLFDKHFPNVKQLNDGEHFDL